MDGAAEAEGAFSASALSSGSVAGEGAIGDGQRAEAFDRAANSGAATGPGTFPSTGDIVGEPTTGERHRAGPAFTLDRTAFAAAAQVATAAIPAGGVGREGAVDDGGRRRELGYEDRAAAAETALWAD